MTEEYRKPATVLEALIEIGDILEGIRQEQERTAYAIEQVLELTTAKRTPSSDGSERRAFRTVIAEN